jgi:hypothetical protein
VDALVNYAGHDLMGPVEAWTMEQVHRRLQGSVFGLIALTEGFSQTRPISLPPFPAPRIVISRPDYPPTVASSPCREQLKDLHPERIVVSVCRRSRCRPRAADVDQFIRTYPCCFHQSRLVCRQLVNNSSAARTMNSPIARRGASA